MRKDDASSKENDSNDRNMDLREDITIGKLLRETAAAYPERR